MIKWLAAPVSILPLAVFRISFGLLMLVSTIRFASKGWIHSLYIEPDFHFSYYGFSWVQPAPEPLLYLIFGLLGASALGVAIGFYYRLCALLFFLSFTYIELLDKAYYLNHYYLVSILAFIILWLPLHRAWSVDCWMSSGLRLEFVPRWNISVLLIQISLVYFFAGIAKLQTDWLLHAMPMKIWLAGRSNLPLVGALLAQPWSAYLFSWLGALYDLSIPIFLWWGATRRGAFVAVIGFHAITAILFPQIGMFPYIMITCALLFFSGQELEQFRLWLLRWLGNLPGAALWPKPTGLPEVDSPQTYTASRWIAGLLTLLLLAQLLLPMRHWLYPGNVLWTEEGFRYSWRVMLVEKTGRTTYMVTEPSTGRTIPIYPSDYLSQIQESQMSYQPDMILEFAHFLEAEVEAAGFSKPEVRAESFVSYNGRPSQLLIDPTVDLAKEKSSLQPKSWILRN